MKKCFLICLTVFLMNGLSAQVSCDSTYALCDSIRIDSVFFTHNENGDRIHFSMQTAYQSLYAPVFSICPDDENTTFLDNDYDFFGIGGPSMVYLYYQFQDFDFSLDSLPGEIILDNSNNSLSDCVIPFNASTAITTNGLEQVVTQNEIILSPNPAKAFLTLYWPTPHSDIRSIQLLDFAGKRQPFRMSDNLMDLSLIPSGLFILHIELNDGTLITKKVIRQ